MIFNLLPQQLWIAENYFSADRFTEIKNLYRKNRINMSMTYDDRILTSWSDSPELQQIVVEQQQHIADIIGHSIAPQVAYVSIDLPGSKIMMHRLHPEIFVQVQICLSEEADSRMDFSFCKTQDINEKSEIDYQPIRRIVPHDVATVPYTPNVASIYVNNPRSFVGMLTPVPPNTIREVLVLSYTKLD